MIKRIAYLIEAENCKHQCIPTNMIMQFSLRVFKNLGMQLEIVNQQGDPDLEINGV